MHVREKERCKAGLGTEQLQACSDDTDEVTWQYAGCDIRRLAHRNSRVLSH